MRVKCLVEDSKKAIARVGTQSSARYPLGHRVSHNLDDRDIPPPVQTCVIPQGPLVQSLLEPWLPLSCRGGHHSLALEEETLQMFPSC